MDEVRGRGSSHTKTFRFIGGPPLRVYSTRGAGRYCVLMAEMCMVPTSILVVLTC